MVAFHMPLDRPNEEMLFSQALLAINQTSYRGSPCLHYQLSVRLWSNSHPPTQFPHLKIRVANLLPESHSSSPWEEAICQTWLSSKGGQQPLGPRE